MRVRSTRPGAGVLSLNSTANQPKKLITRETTVRSMLQATLTSMLCIAPLALAQAQTGASSQSNSRCDTWTAKLVSLEGQVQWRPQGQNQWQTARPNTVFCVGDSLRVMERRAALRLPNDTVVRLKEQTSIKFASPSKSFWVKLIEGAAHFISRTPQPFGVDTPYMNAAVEGTEFLVAAGQQGGNVAVYEGRVKVSNKSGDSTVTSGEQVSVTGESAPHQYTKITLRNSAAWTLFFPPVIPPENLPDAVRKAFTEGDFSRAEQLLAGEKANSAPHEAIRAALVLYRGQNLKARRHLAKAEQLDSSNASVLGLRSLVLLTEGKADEALSLAQSAVTDNADQATLQLALSYAQQANFQLEAAFLSAQNAANLNPDNGLVHARAAELALMTEQNALARHHASQAITLSPRLGRAHSMSGFIALDRLALNEAMVAFNRAIELDQADPMPRLGKGLILIRQGQLKQGREFIELAAALDPGSAIIRSYLGKAYYEEERDQLASPQYDLARQLDANDPTPWFYQALQKQSNNQLIAALDDLDKAITLNDNRAVYRSRLLLDKDTAARSANQGRIYRTLRFDQLAILQGTEAAEQAPGEYSSHRLLAEVYTEQPQFESLRASESLMATLLAPLGAQPLPLGLREIGLLVVDGAGPADMGLNEYNPLFVQEGISGRVSGLVGTQDTSSYEWNINGLWSKGSLNIGQYSYKSDGFRDNNNAEYDISNIMAQFQPTSDLGVQLEYRRRKEDRGDIALQFDIDQFSENQWVEHETDTSRLGINYKISSQSRILGSFIYSEREYDLNDQLQFFGGSTLDIETMTEGRSHLGEIQYQRTSEIVNLIAGFNRIKSETDFEDLSPPAFPFQPPNLPQLVENSYESAYLYTHWPVTSDVKITVGATYSGFRRELSTDTTTSPTISNYEVNPKFGISWNITSDITLRAAGFESIAGGDESILTLEPNHIAGFAQKYDDAEGTLSKVKGIGLDYKPASSPFSASIEYSERDIESVRRTPSSSVEYNYDNSLLKASAYYKFNGYIALATNFHIREFERNPISGILDLNTPVNLKTQTLPITLTINANEYTSVELTANIVEQELLLEDIPPPTFPPGLPLTPGFEDEDSFWTFDTSVRFKLPNRIGVISLEFRNLFDEEFQYRDFNYLTTQPRPQTLITERSVFLKTNFQF